MAELPTGIVTFLFTDIEGSTRLLQELGEGFQEVQDAHAEILREAIARGGGVEVRTEGDAFFVAFPSPAGALLAATTAQRGLAARTWPHGRPVRVRMGLHTGEGRRGGDDYLGIDVNLAARVSAAAHGGQVLLSDATRALAERSLPEGVRLRDLGPHRLKDIAHPVRLYDLAIDGLPSEFPPPVTLDARASNLPPQVTSFVGRERELAQVIEAVETAPLVTLTGPGGTGKTRLALEGAGRMLPMFPDGAFFVDLAPLTDPDLVPSTVARTLEVPEAANRPPIEGVREKLAGTEGLLLVLDNYEHLTEGSSVVEELLGAGPGLRILVTSRVPLRLYGERELPVPPLDLPDPSAGDPRTLSESEAVRLFVDRARAVRPDFGVTEDNAAAVAELCARLDGLPLAIELAASRLRLLSIREVLDGLRRNLPALGAGARNLPERQRTLHGAIGWSYDLLAEPVRGLFARLSAFRGGATLDAVAAVANPDDELGIDTLDGLASLVESSLVRRTETPDGETRFGMLETIGEFAAERCHDADRELTSARHAAHYLALAERAQPELVGSDQVAWLDRCERERGNFRAALRRAIDAGDTATALGIGAALWRFWQQRGPLEEGARLLEDALALDGPRNAVRVRAHWAAGGIAYWRNDGAQTRYHYEEALAIARELGDRRLEMEALSNCGFIPLLEGSNLPGVPEFVAALEIAEELADEEWIARLSGNIAWARMTSGDLDEAIPDFQRTIEFWTRVGNKFEIADAYLSLGHAYRLSGRRAEARPHILRGMDMLLEAGNMSHVTTGIAILAGVASDEGRHREAARLFGAGQALREAVGGGAPTFGLQTEHVMPRARASLGDEEADRLYREGHALDLDAAMALAIEETQR